MNCAPTCRLNPGNLVDRIKVSCYKHDEQRKEKEQAKTCDVRPGVLVHGISSLPFSVSLQHIYRINSYCQRML